MVVVLPAPFGPTKPATTPDGSSRSRWSTAVAVAVALGEAGDGRVRWSHASIVATIGAAVVGRAGGSCAYAPSDVSALPAGADEPGLVGEHHELGPVAGAELDHRPADVGLGRRRAHDRAAAAISSFVRPSATSADDLALAVGQQVEVGQSGRAPWPGSANSSISRRVTPRRQQGVAGDDGAHGAQQLGRLGVLDEEPVGARRGSPRTRTRRGRTS